MEFYLRHKFLPVYMHGNLHMIPNPTYDRSGKYPQVISIARDPIASLSGNVMGGARRSSSLRSKGGSIASKLRSALNQFNRPHFNKQAGGARRHHRIRGRGINII